MIQPLVTVLLILPILIGILSVDSEGNKFGIRQWLADNVLTERVTESIGAYIGAYDNVSNQTTVPQFIEIPTQTENSIDEFTSKIVDGAVFITLQGRDFGIWLGMATAPFHYLLAVLITFSFVYPIMWMYIFGFLYIIITENKEIRHEIMNAKRGKPLE